jgi:Ca-activated chloride channel homolog
VRESLSSTSRLAHGFDAPPEDARFAKSRRGLRRTTSRRKSTGKLTYDDVLEIGQAAREPDPFGYRSELLQLVRTAKAATEIPRLQY